MPMLPPLLPIVDKVNWNFRLITHLPQIYIFLEIERFYSYMFFEFETTLFKYKTVSGATLKVVKQRSVKN